jgi:hypothetical protein
MALADTVGDWANAHPGRDELNGLTGKLHDSVITSANLPLKIAKNSAQSG